MAFTDHKITDWISPVVNEADRPQRTAAELKAVFDSNSNQLKESLNGLIDDFAGTEALENIGAQAPDGFSGETAQEVINSVAQKAALIQTDQPIIRFLSGDGEYRVPTAGEAINGLPLGGTAGQVLTKTSEADYESEWTTPPEYLFNFSATLSATSWLGDAAPYTQTVTITGLLSTDRPIVDVALTGTASTDTAILEAWGLVSRITTADGSITAVCYEDKPEVDIPIQMEVIR